MEVEQESIEGLAIHALGSLFKLTEVYLWDEEGFRFKEQTNFLGDEAGNHSRLKTLSTPPEDAELSMLMNELGLPHSFHTNREKKKKKKRKGKVKTNDLNPVSLDIHDETIANGNANPTKVSETETAPTTVLNDISSTMSSLCSMSKLDFSEPYSSDIAVDAHKTECPFDQEEQLANKSSSIENEDNMKIVAQIDEINDGFLDQSLVIAKNIDHFMKNENGSLLEFACTEGDMADDGDLKSTEAILATYPYSLEVMNPVETDDKGYDASGDWTSHWDTFYMRNYFYNIRTNESTWEPPAGMKHLAFSEADKLVELDIESAGQDVVPVELDIESASQDVVPVELDIESASQDVVPVELDIESASQDVVPVELDIESASQDVVPDTCHLKQSTDGCDMNHNVNSSLAHFDDSLNSNLHMTVMDSSTVVAYIEDSSSTKKKSKKVVKKTRLRRSKREKAEIQMQGILEEFSLTIAKYWWQRYLLFSKFDEGIKMDEEGWFSVTPESIARHQATRCCNGIVIDCFTGMGGNAIQFAMSSNHVIAIDIDPNKIGCAIHNAGIYGVDDRIDFIEGDFFVLGQKLKADTVFLSPPWGGPDYLKAKRYNLQTMLRPLDGNALFDLAKKIAPRVVMFLPRNVDFNQLAELALCSVPPWSLEVERNFLNDKLKAITAYFSDPSIYLPSS